MVNEAQYRRAIEDSHYRQQFLDAVDLEDASPYISSLLYISDESKEAVTITIGGEKIDWPAPTMRLIPSFLSRLNMKWRKSKIRVCPYAFSEKKHPQLDDFLGTLIDHEGYHAKEIFESPETIAYPLWKTVGWFVGDEIVDKVDILDMIFHKFFEFRRSPEETYLGFLPQARWELSAYNNQMMKIGRRNFSQTYIESIKDWQNVYRRYIESMEKKYPEFFGSKR